MPLPKNEAWFAAKTHGWGWGLPLRWQGWVVMVAFVAVMIAISQWLPPHKHPVGFLVAIFGLAAALIAICWLKGEEPRWRWGEDDK
jgi:uncharacterized membrane protein YhaH (DUF805 family)